MRGKERIDLGAFLGEAEPYSVLDAENLRRLAAAARRVRIGRGEALFEQGQACEGVYVVVSGRLKLAFSSPSGAEKIVTIVTSRQSLGEVNLLLGLCYPLHAEALGDSLLAFLPRHVLNDCLKSSQAFVYRMMEFIAEKFHHLLLDVESSSLLSGTERILDFLMREAAVPNGDGSATIELSLPKSIIASRLSLTQEHFPPAAAIVGIRTDRRRRPFRPHSRQGSPEPLPRLRRRPRQQPPRPLRRPRPRRLGASGGGVRARDGSGGFIAVWDAKRLSRTGGDPNSPSRPESM